MLLEAVAAVTRCFQGKAKPENDLAIIYRPIHQSITLRNFGLTCMLVEAFSCKLAGSGFTGQFESSAWTATSRSYKRFRGK